MSDREIVLPDRSAPKSGLPLYSASSTYKAGQAVWFFPLPSRPALYLARQDVPAEKPPSDSSYWDRVSSIPLFEGDLTNPGLKELEKVPAALSEGQPIGSFSLPRGKDFSVSSLTLRLSSKGIAPKDQTVDLLLDFSESDNGDSRKITVLGRWRQIALATKTAAVDAGTYVARLRIDLA